MSPRRSPERRPPLKQKLEELISEMVEGGIRYPDAKREFERRFLAEVIARENGNVSKAAKVLDIHRNTLSKKLTDLKLGPNRR
jgi:DNA-binding NtrC family response regulator